MNVGRVLRVSGPLVVASNMSGAGMYELVRVGPNQLVGEIIKLVRDTASIQCYEETAGLTVGDPVTRTGSPLEVELGPGIVDNIFDGIQRPLEEIGRITNSVYIPRGLVVGALDHKKDWHFVPNSQIKIGSIVTGGNIIGKVVDTNNLLIEIKVLVPPNLAGRVKSFVGEGKYNLDADIMVLENPANVSQTKPVRLSHYWPVRQPRPYKKKMEPTKPLITGQRVLDSLFPAVLGGTCCVPGAFGCGKTVISQALSKHANTAGIIYVGCGERGNEMAEVLEEFPELTVPRQINGRTIEVPIMQRTCLIANTSNMPVAAREASIYTGICLAEYFRDMGYNVAMMADSTSRWAEALREVSGRLGEMPGDAGYPAYLGTRLAFFYERAGYVECLGNGLEGSVTIVGAVSPPGGDFTDPVTASTLNIVQVFWGLDKNLAKKKHFPSLNWNISFSKYERTLMKYYTDQNQRQFMVDVATFKTILQEEKRLLEIVQLVGNDSLSEDQKVGLEVAKIIREDFLQQNGYSAEDFSCSLQKTQGMMRNMCTYYELCMNAVNAQDEGEQITYSRIANHLNPAKSKNSDEKKSGPMQLTILERLVGMKNIRFHPAPAGQKRGPQMSDAEVVETLNTIRTELTNAFRTLRSV